MKTHLLIDADYYVYHCGRLYEDTINWGNDFLTTTCDLRKAKNHLDRMIRELRDKTQAA